MIRRIGILVFMGLFLSMGTALAQEVKAKDVPKNIITQFKAKNPAAKNAVWEKADTKYEVTFREEKTENIKSVYSLDGKWEETVYPFETIELPTNIITYLKKTHPKYDRIDDAVFVKQNGEKDTYIINVVFKDKKIVSVMKFSVTGRYQSQEDIPLVEGKKTQSETQAQTTETGAASQGKRGKSSKKTEPLELGLISESRVPPAVMKTFKKKLMNATDVRWYFFENDTFYTAKCLFKEMRTVGVFSQSGLWISTSSELESGKLSSSVHKSIKTFFPNYKVVSASRETRYDKKDGFIVEILEGENIKKGNKTTIYTDKSGRITKIDDAVDAVASSGEEVLTKQQLKEEARIEKEFEKDKRLDIYPAKIKESELPTAILRWVVVNYPDYIYKEINYEEYDEFPTERRIYRIMIQRSGVNQPFAILYATRDGKILKVEDEFREEAERLEKEREINMGIRKADIKKEVPSKIAEVFKKQYPKAVKPKWEEDQDDNWVATFKDRDMENMAVYTPEASWVKTSTKVEPYQKIPSAIRSYVTKTYPGVEIETCLLIRVPESKMPVYEVTLYQGKKSKTYFELKFTSSGKVIEED